MGLNQPEKSVNNRKGMTGTMENESIATEEGPSSESEEKREISLLAEESIGSDVLSSPSASCRISVESSEENGETSSPPKFAIDYSRTKKDVDDVRGDSTSISFN